MAILPYTNTSLQQALFGQLLDRVDDALGPLRVGPLWIHVHAHFQVEHDPGPSRCHVAPAATWREGKAELATATVV